MDRIDFHKRCKDVFAKYKYVLLILCVGILLMSIPENTTPTPQQPIHTSSDERSASDKLEEILSQIAGVGKVKVLLTESTGPETIYQTDRDGTSSNDSETVRIETVIVSNSSREETGLVRSVSAPVYLGAIIVCQGGDNPGVKLSIVQAVSNVTGITTDRITVLKMK